MVDTTTESGVSVLILTWEGLPLVKECVAEVIAQISQWNVPHEVILIDNGSTDGTVAYVRDEWPDVKVVALDKNYGFGVANNKAVQQTQYDVLLFLNNDLVLEEGFIEPMLDAVRRDNVFAVAPKILRWDKITIDDGLRYADFYSGLFDVKLDTDQTKIDLPHYVTFFCGACFVCKKDLFLAMGGFDALYTPYAWEDLDLGYRAWKRGLTVVYEPKAIAYHKREATTRSLFSQFFFITLMWRNKFIFMWKNLTDADIRREHFLLVPWKLLKFTCNGRWRYVIGFFRALRYVPTIIRRRRAEQKECVRTDREVLAESYRVKTSS